MTISPCQHPGCNRDNGNPELTRYVFCDHCTHWFKRTMQWVLEDYVTLKTELPKPFVSSSSGRGSQPTGFGHPREWASNLAQDISKWVAEVTNNWLEANNHPTRVFSEDGAIRYAVNHWPRWTETWAQAWDSAGEIAAEAQDLHRKARAGMGHTRMVTSLSAPCPMCDMLALVQVSGSEGVQCEYCGMRYADYAAVASTVIVDEQRRAEQTIDQLIEAYEGEQ